MQLLGTSGLVSCITSLVPCHRAVGLALITVLAAGPLSGCSGSSSDSTGKPSAKVDPDLLALHESYREAQQRGADLRPNNSLLRVVDNRVVIDATATGDALVLQADLVRLGMRNAAVLGRIVSGELPIAAIPTLATLASLAFARPATAQGRSRGRPERPSRP